MSDAAWGDAMCSGLDRMTMEAEDEFMQPEDEENRRHARLCMAVCKGISKDVLATIFGVGGLRMIARDYLYCGPEASSQKSRRAYEILELVSR